MNKLTGLMLEAGLLQFGWFEPEGIPLRLSLEMLPAYPDILAQIVAEGMKHTSNMNRLVCTIDALPLGVGLSLKTNIPLVYSRGSGEAPYHDLVGAYDIGHPALLLVNALDNTESTTKLIHKARSVGLQIQYIVAIMDLGIPEIAPDIEVYTLLSLENEIQALIAEGRLASGQGQAVLNWLKESANRRHPGSEAP